MTVVTVAALGLVGGGCGDDGGEAAAGGEEPSSAAPGDTTGLEGRAFLSAALTEAGQPKALVEGTRVRVELHDDGRMTVQAGCNTMGATPTISANRIDVGEGMEMTEMACEPGLMAQDDWLRAFFTDSPTYVLDGDTLQLTAGDRAIELVDREVADPDQPLEGTMWALDGLVEDGGVSSVPGDVAATLTFEAGTVAVDGTGCNGGSGSYTIEGGEAAAAGELTLSALMWTMMACGEPSATVEAALSAVLDGTITYEIEAGTLTLTHPDGQGLTLRAA